MASTSTGSEARTTASPGRRRTARRRTGWAARHRPADQAPVRPELLPGTARRRQRGVGRTVAASARNLLEPAADPGPDRVAHLRGSPVADHSHTSRKTLTRL